jgi:hypothetical protein
MDTVLGKPDHFGEEVDIQLRTEAQPAVAPIPSQPTKLSFRLPRKPVALPPLRTPLFESKESQYRVLYDFASQDENETKLRKDDIITIIGKEENGKHLKTEKCQN